MAVFTSGGNSGVSLPSLSNPASAAQILNGYQAINEDADIITGSIPSRSSSNVTTSGRTVTIPAGYYPSQISKTVSLPSLSNPAGASQILKGYQALNGSGSVITGNINTVTQATPDISVSSSGLITASATQSAGYVSSGTKSDTYQLTTQAGRTITPGISQQTACASGRYTTGNIYVAGDSDLVASNIRSGVNIFGVTGTYNGESIPIVKNFVDQNAWLRYVGRERNDDLEWINPSNPYCALYDIDYVSPLESVGNLTVVGLALVLNIIEGSYFGGRCYILGAPLGDRGTYYILSEQTNWGLTGTTVISVYPNINPSSFRIGIPEACFSSPALSQSIEVDATSFIVLTND